MFACVNVYACIYVFNPLMPNGAFNICCPRDCVSRHNGGTSGAPLKPLRVDSGVNIWSTFALGQQMLIAPVGINGLITRALILKKMSLMEMIKILSYLLREYTYISK